MSEKGGKVTKTDRCEKCGHKCKDREYTSLFTILGTAIVVLMLIAVGFGLVYLGIQLERKDIAKEVIPERITTIADVKYSSNTYYYNYSAEAAENGSSLFADINANNKKFAIIKNVTDYETLISSINRNQSYTTSDILPEYGNDFFTTGTITAIGIEGIGIENVSVTSVSRNEDYNLSVDLRVTYAESSTDKTGAIVMISTENISPEDIIVNIAKIEN